MISSHVVVAAAVLLVAAEGNTMFVAEKCKGHNCVDPVYPMLDYDLEAGKCKCRKHPCWNDDGKHHLCESEEFPYLKYHYNEDGTTLNCECSAKPHYSPLVISRDLCPGHDCEQEGFVVDYDEQEEKCICRQHPCLNDNGNTHACESPEFPILRFRGEKATDGSMKTVCECMKKIDVDPEHTEI